MYLNGSILLMKRGVTPVSYTHLHIAGSLAFKDAMQKAAPVLLEPIMKVKVTTPEDYMGDVCLLYTSLVLRRNSSCTEPGYGSYQKRKCLTVRASASGGL